MEFLDKPLMAKYSVRLAAGPIGKTDEDILVGTILQTDTTSTSQAHQEVASALANGSFI